MTKLQICIRDELFHAHISKAYKGYPFLEYAIYLVLEDESRIQNLHGDLYLRIAAYYDVSSSSVEKNLRTLRDAFWQNYGYEYFKDECGIIFRERPFPREIIEVFAERISRAMLEDDTLTLEWS